MSSPQIVLKKKIIILKVKKKTKARALKNVKVYDILEFTLPLEAVGSSYGSGRSYAAEIKILNRTNGETTTKTLNEMKIINDLFEWELV